MTASNVRIFKQMKNPTQSGRGRTKNWVLEYELETKRQPEALMGWVASGDTLNQVKIGFDTLEDAVAFAEKKGLSYTVVEVKPRRVKGQTYMDNFKYSSPADTQ
ncbi:MAG: oxidoreductase [Alphaproteobacteria bacterium]|nr:oxidoreductase [Alphaproteobacteria bacterium]